MPAIKFGFNRQTAGFIFLHICALASAILIIGPQTIRDLFSHDPAKVVIAVCGAIVALGSTMGAAASPALMQHYGWVDISTPDK